MIEYKSIQTTITKLETKEAKQSGRAGEQFSGLSLLLADFLKDMVGLLFDKKGVWRGPLKITQPLRIWKIAKVTYRLVKLLIRII